MKVTIYIERDPESGMYVATIPSISQAHTQAETLDELHKNLQEVVQLCLEEMDPEEKKLIPEFVAISQLEIPVD